MQFDFDTFASITAMVFPGDSPYSLEEALEVFRYYFEQYEQHTGKPHPHINAAQIVHICEIMLLLSFLRWRRRKPSRTAKSVIFGNPPSRNAL